MRMPNVNRERPRVQPHPGSLKPDAHAPFPPLHRIIIPQPTSFVIKLSKTWEIWWMSRFLRSPEPFRSVLSSLISSVLQVVRDDGLLRGVPEGDSGLRDGDEGADQRLPLGVLRLPAVQPQVCMHPRGEFTQPSAL